MMESKSTIRGKGNEEERGGGEDQNIERKSRRT
jgi:hypothetical protein